MLSISNVSKSFANARGEVTNVLDGVSLEVDPGDFVVIVGPSGCGKSTLLRLVAGFIAPTTGSIEIDGKPVDGPDPSRGMVFQKPTLFPWLTVAQNVGFGPKARGEKDGLEDRVDHLLELAGLTEFRDSYPHELSGGMAQRVSLVRTMIMHPEVFLLDEPLGALDAFTRMGMQDALLGMWSDRRSAMLMVTHDVDEAVYLGTRIVVMAPRPSRVVEEIPIELEYPRVRTEERFTAYRNHILDLLNFGKTSDVPAGVPGEA